MAKVLVLGSGSREHALAAALVEEGHTILSLPGNTGTAGLGASIPGRPDDVDFVLSSSRRASPDLIVVGPEQPLVAGVADALRSDGWVVFGPGKEAARLEGSKVFMKRFLDRHGIPTASYRVFDDADLAEAYVRDASRPLVVKADGLAAGKGVAVCTSTEAALAAVSSMLRDRAFGEAGTTILIEEVLPGEEASFHVLCDGNRAVPLVAAQDHKRVRDHDEGPNTGGMGAYAPAPIVDDAVREAVTSTIVNPTLAGMRQDGLLFRGVLFIGLMIENGVPRVLEYNVRFGDPEACVILPLYRGRVFRLLDAAARGTLPDDERPAHGHALVVVMAAAGYPSKPAVGDPIYGLEATLEPGQFVRHAGVRKREDGAIVTAGGRVLAVGSTGATLAGARDAAYRRVAAIRFEGEHHRTDIGSRALTAERGRG